MKFKRLHESISSDELYKKLVDFIKHDLIVTIDCAKDNAEVEFPEYRSEYFYNSDPELTNKYITQLAEQIAEDMLRKAPDEID